MSRCVWMLLVGCLALAALSGVQAAWLQWEQIEPGRTFVDLSVGRAGVFATTGTQQWYRLNTRNHKGKGSDVWSSMGDFKMNQLNVGLKSVWGIDADTQWPWVHTGMTKSLPAGDSWALVYDGDFDDIPKLKHVAVSDRGIVWATDENDQVLFRDGASNQNPKGNSWSTVGGLLKQVDVDQAGVWGVNFNDQVFYRDNTYNNAEGSGTKWTLVDGGLRQVSVGKRFVAGVNSLNQLFIRKQVSSKTPTGTEWEHVGNDFKKVAAGRKDVWGLDTAGGIWHASYVPCTCTCDP